MSLIVTFWVTEEGEEMHPHESRSVILNACGDGVDNASMSVLRRVVTEAAVPKFEKQTRDQEAERERWRKAGIVG